MSGVRVRAGSGWLALIAAAAWLWLMPFLQEGAPGLSRLLHTLVRGPGDDLQAVLLWDGTLPRVAVGLMTGAALGLSGTLLQQITGNPLASPMTLGAASGAWLGMTCGAVWAPVLLAAHPDWLALGGAATATALLLLLAGLRRLASLELILSGMALNILLGSLAAAVALLNDRYAAGVFVWGAGDLAQYDWHWAHWLAPRLLWPLLLLPGLRAPLELLRLGTDAAAGRGLALAPALLTALLLSLWLCAVAVAAVGLIGFISVLAPVLARRAGARAVHTQWLAGALLGALMLLIADGLALGAASVLTDSVPSGAAAALLGAPALVWLLRHAQGTGEWMPPGATPASGARRGWGLLLVLALASVAVSRAPEGWVLAWPEASLWWLRWPRLLAAAAAGAGLSLAGVILQRLLRNPLASPDMLGISAGATLAVMLQSALTGLAIGQGAWLAALGGSALTLLALTLIGRRVGWAPPALALIGLSLSALLDGVVQCVLARGTLDSVAVLGWLAGSTYRVGPAAALALAAAVGLCLVLACTGRRSLALLSLGDAVAAGCGLRVGPARAAWLALAALLSALVTSLLGPVAFVGLLTPHLALRLGARRCGAQLAGAAVAGAALMMIADMLGRTVLWPAQMPVGLCAALLCGALLAVALRSGRAGR